MVRWKIAVPFVVLSLALTACGDSDDEDDKDKKASDEPTMSAAEQKACDALVAAPGVILQAAGETPTAEQQGQLSALYTDIAAGTTGEAKAAAEAVVATIAEAQETDNMELLESDEYTASLGAPAAAGRDLCGFEAVDYNVTEHPHGKMAPEIKFNGLPAELDAGTYSLGLENKGKQFHEQIVVKLKDDYTGTLEEFKAASDEEKFANIEGGGVAYSPPTMTGYLNADLTRPGRYIVFCHIPLSNEKGVPIGENGKPAKGPQAFVWHFDLGMAQIVTVS